MRHLLIIVYALAIGATVVAAEDAGVDGSSDTVRPKSIEDIYTGGKLRDPFVALGGAGGAPSSSVTDFDMADFSIHELELKGIMRDKNGAFAMLIDESTRTGFILRRGRVYTYKNERVPGVTGRINLAQKTVVLITVDKDVQTLRLGEDEEEGEDDEEPADEES
jgi:hypothetical protein